MCYFSDIHFLTWSQGLVRVHWHVLLAMWSLWYAFATCVTMRLFISEIYNLTSRFILGCGILQQIGRSNRWRKWHVRPCIWADGNVRLFSCENYTFLVHFKNLFLLEFCRSRLGCQVIANPELDGLRLALPSATRNFAVDGYVPKPHWWQFTIFEYRELIWVSVL